MIDKKNYPESMWETHISQRKPQFTDIWPPCESCGKDLQAERHLYLLGTSYPLLCAKDRSHHRPIWLENETGIIEYWPKKWLKDD